MTYIRGDVAELNAWEDLGNSGWNWDTMLPYYKKAENYTKPNAEQTAAGVTYDPQYHGDAGAVHVGYPITLVNGTYAPTIMATWEGLSMPLISDVNGGHVRGLSIGPETIDREQHLRYDAARAYYYPVEHRANLQIFHGTVKGIVWSQSKSGCDDKRLVASGVEVVAEGGATSVIQARREVILSAGSVRTPLVLEASGVGNPRFVPPSIQPIFVSHTPLLFTSFIPLVYLSCRDRLRTGFAHHLTESLSPSALRHTSIFQELARTSSSKQTISSATPAP